VFFVFDGMARGRTCRNAQTDVFYMSDVFGRWVRLVGPV
jgi:hypothetical protein